LDRRVEHDVSASRERRVKASDDGDDGHAPVLHVRQKLQDLRRLAAVADDDDRVVAVNYPDAAVQRVRGVQEDGGRARARQRGGDLLRDVAGLADADRHEVAAAGGEETYGVLDRLARQPPGRPLAGLRLHAQKGYALLEV